MTIGELKAHLAPMDDDAPCAYSLWLTADVLSRAEVHDAELTDDEVADTLDTMQRRFDASIGMNWDTLDAAMPD